jgi:hypothetical protein
MNDIARLLERQAQWQKSLRDLPWPEKIRMVEAAREDIAALRAEKKAGAPSDAPARKR